MRKLLIGTGLVTLILAGCTSPVPPSASEETSSSSVASQWVSYEGTVQKLGVTMFMEGTHRLVTEENETALLESDTIVLDDYVDAKVRITGSARATVENGGLIVNVDGIERVLTDDQPSVLEESSSSMTSSALASSSLSSLPSSSSLPQPALSSVEGMSSSSSVRPVSSSAPFVSSAKLVQSSSAAQVSSLAVIPEPTEPAPPASASVEAMAKAKVDAANFTQKYCTSHIGFCIPVHRNWFYVSFGANVSPSLWHVELSDQEIEEAGQGAITVDLVSGPFSGTEGVAISVSGMVVASRQWTGNRHFQVSGPPQLKAAVEFIAQNLATSE